ncbi:hypothetical protein K501DRAFT_276822 [Backusella circina FSU 941]|nr:hypothetical protein K501DRAFT_276822 [Backusella circina FSU 941]
MLMIEFNVVGLDINQAIKLVKIYINEIMMNLKASMYIKGSVLRGEISNMMIYHAKIKTNALCITLRGIFDKVHEIVIGSEVPNRNGRSSLKYDRVEDVDVDIPVVNGESLDDWMVNHSDADEDDDRDSMDRLINGE